MLEILSQWMGLWMQKSRVRFWSTLQYNLEAVRLALAHCQFSKRIVKHTLSVIDWPLHHWPHWSTDHPERKELWMSFKKPENYSWRLFKTNYKNPSCFNEGCTKYWLSSLIQLYKLCFRLICYISIYLCRCFIESLQLFSTKPFHFQKILRTAGWLRAFAY